MLSGETASGKYPLEAVQTMAKIAVRTENALDYVHIFQKKGISERIHSTDAISHATVQISQEIKADTILTITESGFTARMIAKYKLNVLLLLYHACLSACVRCSFIGVCCRFWGHTPQILMNDRAVFAVCFASLRD